MKRATKIFIAILAVSLCLFACGKEKSPVKPGFNELEKEKIANAVWALEDSSYTGLDLANRIYVHAFTSGNFISENITENTLSDLSEGKASDTVLSMVVPKVTADALEDGDILLAEDKVYFYATEGLRDLNSTGAPKADTAAVLESLSKTKHALLRPAYALPILDHGDPDAPKDTLNEYQEAVIATAKAFLLRGEKLQYADTRLTDYGPDLDSQHRWHLRINTPEDCTDNYWGYTNCAVFCHDVYYQALGLILPDQMHTTKNMATYSAINGTQVYRYERGKSTIQSDEEKAKVEQEFTAALQPGDIIVIRRENNSGHALLYIGNGDIIHSSGSIFDYKTGEEKYEATIRQVKVKDYFFNPVFSPNGYVFTKALQLQILRPLNIFAGEIPVGTQNRVQNMQGIMAQKLCSHVRAQTVAPGGELIYTYEIFNTNSQPVTLEITENVPEDLTYLSGCDNVSGSKLTWSVTVPAGERIQVSYKAKVNEDTPYGTTILSEDSTVGGVSVNCQPVTVRNTLTPEQQAKFTALQAGETTGFALLNDLYGKEVFSQTDAAAIAADLFVETQNYGGKAFFGINENSLYAPLTVPGFYGGRYLWTPAYEYDRSSLARPQDLQVGDVLIYRTELAAFSLIYLGEERGFVDLNTLQPDDIGVTQRLEQLLISQCYALLRPAQALETP